MDKRIVKEFQDIANKLNLILHSLTEEQLNQVPFPQSWTAGQVGDHLLKSFNSWTIMDGETSTTTRQIDENCKPLSDLFLDFEIKMSAEPSDFNYPTNDYIKKENLLTELEKVTSAIISFSNQNELGLLCLDFELPTFGHLTRFEWLHFYVVHTQRHIHQLKNIINKIKS